MSSTLGNDSSPLDGSIQGGGGESRGAIGQGQSRGIIEELFDLGRAGARTGQLCRSLKLQRLGTAAGSQEVLEQRDPFCQARERNRNLKAEPSWTHQRRVEL